MTARTWDGRPLTPGVNVDPVNLPAGLAMANRLGYVVNGNDRFVVEYALARWARGEEDGAEKTWMSHFGKQAYTDWRAVIAAAVAQGTADFEEAHRGS